MVNNSNSVPPSNPNPPHQPPENNGKKTNSGGFHFKGEHKFLHMTFSAEEWDKLMNLMVRNVGDYINKTMQKMTEKLKKDWKRGAGEDVDDS